MKIIARVTDVSAVVHAGGDVETRSAIIEIPEERWSPKFGQCVKVDCHTLTKEEHP